VDGQRIDGDFGSADVNTVDVYQTKDEAFAAAIDKLGEAQKVRLNRHRRHADAVERRDQLGVQWQTIVSTRG
jgi:hypothetical protein